MKRIMFWGLICCGLVALLPEKAQPIPAFARKYGFSCKTCHLAMPKLKEYGEEFAGNGFRLPEGEEPPRAYKDTGDDKLLLQRELPVAIRFDAYGLLQSNHADTRTNDKIYSDLETPYGLKILSGGSIAKNIGYYFYFYFSERGEVAGIEDAIIHFNNIKGSELDIVVGQFQISDPLFKRELRLTYEDYQIYKTKIGDSETNLTYDRGIMMTYGFSSNTDVVFELVNGNGKDEAGDDRIFDIDSYKNPFFKINQSFPFVRLGMFGYFGSEKAYGEKNDFSMWGPDATIGNEKAELNLQFVRRKDDNPFFRSFFPHDIMTDGFFGELVFNPVPEKSELLGVILYNKITSDLSYYNYETITGNLSYLLRRNLRLLFEVTHDSEQENTKFIAGFVAGF